MRLFRLTALLISLVALRPIGAEASQIVHPDKDLSPEDVVFIQLHALGGTDTDDRRKLLAGLAQVWAFAHPVSRHVLGPFPRFATILLSPKYRMLVDHRSYHLERVRMNDDEALFAVRITGRRGGVYGYRWKVNKVGAGVFAGTWMTTSVRLVAHLGAAI